jgi:hypothetical protein
MITMQVKRIKMDKQEFSLRCIGAAAGTLVLGVSAYLAMMTNVSWIWFAIIGFVTLLGSLNK